MGEVIAFRMRENGPRRASAPPQGDAQILFFLGVRYLHIEEPPDAARSPGDARGPGGGRKRKTRARA